MTESSSIVDRLLLSDVMHTSLLIISTGLPHGGSCWFNRGAPISSVGHTLGILCLSGHFIDS